MHPRIKQDIVSLAQANKTEEICGFMYHDGLIPHLMPCQNIAKEPTKHFEISIQDQIRFEQLNTPLGVYHSHPEGGAFSPNDLFYAEEINLPQFVYDLKNEKWYDYTPAGFRPNLEGRPFILGFYDCYGLLRDFSKQELGHHMNDYDRDESFGTNGDKTILDHVEIEGFERTIIENAKPGNVLLFKSGIVLPQHFAVLRPGNKILHHPLGGLSRTEHLTDRWLSRLIGVFQLKIDPNLV